MPYRHRFSLVCTLPILLFAAGAGCAPSSQRVDLQASTGLDQADLGPLELSHNPVEAIEALQIASNQAPVAVFKHSPICPISAAAQVRFQDWMKGAGKDANVRYAHIDVIEERPLARGLVAELGIKHESPQVLLFSKGEVVWHASHGAITGESLSDQINQISPEDS